MRWLWRGLLALALGVIALELFARFGLGLGTPPLFVNDPDLEYRFAPSQDLRRFHNRVKFNRWSMRSDDFPAEKESPDEARVLVMGDSVVNGGMRIDQADLATDILQRELRAERSGRVWVGNVSCGSWGPPNLLAYARKFGWFEADFVAIVINSEDFADTLGPTGVAGTRHDMPVERPALALIEAHHRYLRRYLPVWLSGYPETPPRAEEPVSASAPEEPPRESPATEALRELIEAARATGAEVFVVQHLTQREIEEGPQAGHAGFAAACREAGVEPIQLAPAMKAAREAGASPYQDNIHLSAEGQRVLAETVLGPIREALNARAPAASEPARSH